MAEMVLHIDADAFAVSVERARRQAHPHEPVIIGNEAAGRGLVICASYEIRPQVRPGMPLSVARRKAPRARVIPEHRLEYEHYSQQLLELLRCHAPAVEVAALDDFYLDVTGCEKLYGGDLVTWGLKLKQTILKQTGIPVSLGLATNKMIARIATRLAKTGHLIEVLPGFEQDFLSPVPVGMLPGVGEKTDLRLREMGIRHVGQLAALDVETLTLLFGSSGCTIHERAHGVYHEPVCPSGLHRTISHKHQFETDTPDPDKLHAAVVLLAQRLTASLRQHRVRASQAQLTLHYTDGLTESRAVRLEFASNQDFDFIPPVQRALDTLFARRVRVRTLLLQCHFVPMQDGQFDLFEERRQTRQRALYQAIDQIRQDHGFAAIVSARAVNAQ